MAVNRVQLALNVADLDAAVDFYRRLFGVEVHKRRAGYANFAIADPPLKLVLFEAPNAAQQLNHLGVEMASPDEVVAVAARFERAGLATQTVEGELCCHAVQDKVYVQAADVPGGQWEFYTVVDDDPAEATAEAAAPCCPTDGQDALCCSPAPATSTAGEAAHSRPTASRRAAGTEKAAARREGVLR